MRLFVAFDVPAALRAELGRRAEPLRRRLPRASWVRADGMHLTLAFLGDTDPGLLPALGGALAAAFAGSPPLELVARGVGGFPERGPARVAWVGLASTPPVEAELQALQRRVAEAVRAVTGVPPERRPFHPHLTVARCRPPWRRDDVERLAAGLGRFDGVLGEPFTVAAGVLFESELRPAGAVYTTRGRYPLAAPLAEAG